MKTYLLISVFAILALSQEVLGQGGAPGTPAGAGVPTLFDGQVGEPTLFEDEGGAGDPDVPEGPVPVLIALDSPAGDAEDSDGDPIPVVISETPIDVDPPVPFDEPIGMAGPPATPSDTSVPIEEPEGPPAGTAQGESPTDEGPAVSIGSPPADAPVPELADDGETAEGDSEHEGLELFPEEDAGLELFPGGEGVPPQLELIPEVPLEGPEGPPPDTGEEVPPQPELFPGEGGVPVLYPGEPTPELIDVQEEGVPVLFPEDPMPELYDAQVMGALISRVDSLEQDVTTLNTKVGELTSQLASQSQELEWLREQQQNTSNQVVSMINMSEMLVADPPVDVASQMAVLSGETGQLTAYVNSLQSNLAEMTSAIARLEGSTTSQNVTLSGVHEAVLDLYGQMGNVNSSVSGLASAVSSSNLAAGSAQESTMAAMAVQALATEAVVLELWAELNQTRQNVQYVDNITSSLQQAVYSPVAPVSSLSCRRLETSVSGLADEITSVIQQMYEDNGWWITGVECSSFTANRTNLLVLHEDETRPMQPTHYKCVCSGLMYPEYMYNDCEMHIWQCRYA